jgi:hypothetical protein
MTLPVGTERATRKIIAAKPGSELTATQLEDLLTSNLFKPVRQLGSCVTSGSTTSEKPYVAPETLKDGSGTVVSRTRRPVQASPPKANTKKPPQGA